MTQGIRSKISSTWIDLCSITRTWNRSNKQKEGFGCQDHSLGCSRHCCLFHSSSGFSHFSELNGTALNHLWCYVISSLLRVSNLPSLFWPDQAAISLLERKHKLWVQAGEGGERTYKQQTEKIGKWHFLQHIGMFKKCERYSWLDEMNSSLGTSLACVLRGHLKSIEIILN